MKRRSRMHRVERCAVRTLAYGALLLWLTSAVGGAQDAAPEPPRYAADLERVEELRRSAELGEALSVARSLHELALDDERLPAWFRGDVERLVETLEAAITWPEERRSELVEATRLAHDSAASFQAGNRPRASDEARRRLELLVALLGPAHPDALWARVDYSWRLAYQQDVAGFLSQARRALEGARSSLGEEHPLVAVCLAAEGYALLNSGRTSEARASMEASRELWLALETELDVHAERRAFPSNGLALIANSLGEYDAADRYFLECVELVRHSSGEKSESYANLLGNIGSALVQRGEWGRAEPLLKRSLALSMELLPPENPAISATLSNLAVVYQTVGDYGAVDELVGDALRIVRASGAAELQLVNLLNNLALANLARGDAQRAVELAERARELGRAFDDRHAERAVWSATLANAYLAAGELDKAFRLHGEIVDLALDQVDSEEVLEAEYVALLGRIHVARGEDDDAEAFFEFARRIFERELPPSHPYRGGLLLSLARLSVRRGELEEAEALYAEATALQDAARARAPTGLARATFAARQSHGELAWVRAALGDADGAWEAAERGRGRTLFELIQAARVRRMNPAMARRHDELQRELLDLERRLAAGEGDASSTRARLLTVDASLDALLEQIESRSPLVDRRPFPLGRVRASLAPDEAAIGWVEGSSAAGERGLWSWAVRHEGEVRWSFLSADARLAKKLNRFRVVLAEAALDPFVVPPAEPDAFARELGEALFGPLAAAGALDGVAHLVVVPSAPVLGIPLEALALAEGDYVGERWTLSYAHSGTVYAFLRERDATPASPRQRPALVVGDPPFRPEHLKLMETESAARSRPRSAPGADWRVEPSALPRIPGTRDEAQHIATLFAEATVLLGPDASELAVGGLDLSSFGTLHLATHALVDDARPDRSALVLSQVGLADSIGATLSRGRSEDGLITAREIVATWRLDAELVTLSACETALGAEVAGEGYLGLAYALLQTGARSVLASLWSVDDAATKLFMVTFYEAWLERVAAGTEPPRAKAEALRAARRALREHADPDGRRPFAHPGSWAAFVLIGDPR